MRVPEVHWVSGGRGDPGFLEARNGVLEDCKHLLLGTFFVTMASAGYIVKLLFDVLGLIPTGPRHPKVVEATIQLNYTTVLNTLFPMLAAAAGCRSLPPAVARCSR